MMVKKKGKIDHWKHTDAELKEKMGGAILGSRCEVGKRKTVHGTGDWHIIGKYARLYFKYKPGPKTLLSLSCR